MQITDASQINTRVFLATTGRDLVRACWEVDGGWQVETRQFASDVCCLVPDPGDRATVYAGMREDGLWRSRDRGYTWEQVSEELGCTIWAARQAVKKGGPKRSFNIPKK